VNFINADLIAAGLSPLKPQLAAIAAARLVLQQLDRLVDAGSDFAFESTLSGLSYVPRLRRMKERGYHIEIIYLRIVSAGLAIKRIASRVQQGGHDVPKVDVRRRFTRSWSNFENVYRPLADAWAVYDNSSKPPKLIGSGP
jgi:predicted ABC-type ATPase